MTDTPQRLSAAVRRVLARDDLLMTAVDADKAVGIVRQREALARLAEDEKSLFSVALKHYLDVADSDEGWATRAQAWKHAGVIVRFSALVGIEVEFPAGRWYTTEELHARSLRDLGDTELSGDPASARDLTLHAFHRYRMVRDLRLSGDRDRFDEAFRLAAAGGPEGLNGSGAEPHVAHLMFEIGAIHLLTGQAAQVDNALQEAEPYFAEQGAHFPTRYRFELVRGLGRWETGEDDAGTREALDSALSQVRAAAAASDGPDDAGQARSIEELSATLAKAEYLAERDPSPAGRAEAVDLGLRALAIADDVRDRWRVIARSRAPLAVVFQRVYGDIALLAATVAAPEAAGVAGVCAVAASGAAVSDAAARLGLRVALSAKQTGFAARIRSGRALMSSRVEGIIEDIMDVEEQRLADAEPGGDQRSLDKLRFELEQAVSPMLADTVLPAPADLDVLTGIIGDRYALDYLELTDSLAGVPNLFRTLITPDGRISFERFVPDGVHAAFFTQARRHGNLAGKIRRSRDARPAGPHRDDRLDWHALGEDVLPAALRADLAVADLDRPIELLVSAHSWLSLIPWPALGIDRDTPVRLVERAVITQTPALTCLQHSRTPAVTGRALIRLVGGKEGVKVAAERGAWGLPENNESVELSTCVIGSGGTPEPCDERLADALRVEGRWGFVHIASHGGGDGLTQYLMIPPESLSFGRALGLKWPGSVLMASCHVGRVVNLTEAEPISMVMALLSGGARCVVAGIAAIDDRGTARAASHIVRSIRGRELSLDRALRDAQLAAIGRPEQEWALLAAYTQ